MADNSSFPLSNSARLYAGVLFDIASQTSCRDQMAKLLPAIAALLAESADFRRFIASPLYNIAAQERVIAALARRAGLDSAKGAGPLFHHFLNVLVRHRRLYLLPDILAAFQALLSAGRGEIAVFITAAEALSAQQQREVLALLAGAAAENAVIGQYFTGKKPVMHKRVDPALLGGFILRCGSLWIDTSLRTKLSVLKRALKEVG